MENWRELYYKNAKNFCKFQNMVLRVSTSSFSVFGLVLKNTKKRIRSVLNYALPVAFVAVCGTAIEFDEYQHAVTDVNEAARRDSQAYANLIMERLDTRFTELDMALAALRGPDDRTAPLSPQVELSLRHYLLSRPTYLTFSVLGADGESIQWSTSPHKKSLAAPLRNFSIIPKMPIIF